MSIIRTVRGDIPPSSLGPTDAHEHLFFVSPLQPGDDFTDMACATEEARRLRAAGAQALVDWTPLGLGRNVEGLLRVSEATGLHVVAATGVHREAHYAADHPLRTSSVGSLAEVFVDDLLRPSAPSGVIKVGASYHHLSAFERRVFEAAAVAHARTGAPVCVHTEHGTLGLDIVETLGALGVAPRSVVLAHLDRNPDPGEHAEIGQTGAWIQYDGPGRAKYWPDSTILGLIDALVRHGLADRLLLGGDTGRRSMMRAYGGGPGLDYLFRRFKPRLERELGPEIATRIFVQNPASAFAFTPARSAAAPATPARPVDTER